MDFGSNFKSEVVRFCDKNDKNSSFLPQPPWSSDKKTGLAVSKIDRKLKEWRIPLKLRFDPKIHLAK